MIRNLMRITAVLVVAVLMSSCSKSSSPTGNSTTAPKLSAPTFSGPNSTSATKDTSQGYQTATYTAALFNGVASGYLGYYTGTGTQNGNTWTWTASSNGNTATWTATTSSGGYDWNLVYSGVWSGSNGNTNVNNWTVVSGHESSDGKNGNWTAYAPGSTDVIFTISWSTDGNNNLTGTIIDNADGQKFVFTNNNDKSGSLKIYTGTTFTTQVWNITWLPNGSGSYWGYDSQGNYITGSWS